MNYRIESTPRRRGPKRWKLVTRDFRYASLEGAEAHCAYLRFQQSKLEFRIKKEDEDWVGTTRNFFRAEDVVVHEDTPPASIPDPFAWMARAGISITPSGVLSVPAVPRGRRIR